MRSAIAGIVLADGSSDVTAAVRALVDGGCEPVLVVLGGHEDHVRTELAGLGAQWVDVDLRVIACPTWERGSGELLRTGLEALPGLADETHLDLKGAVVTSPDLPDLHADLVERLRDADPRGSGALATTVRNGVPGRPVLLGRDRWAEAAQASHDDDAAYALLTSPGTVVVDATAAAQAPPAHAGTVGVDESAGDAPVAPTGGSTRVG